MLKLDISGVHMQVDPKLNKYIKRKIGKLDRYLPKNGRSTAHGKVILKEHQGKKKNPFTCEVILDVPKNNITAKEATINIYAAIDIVEEKLKTQLQKYKDKQGPDKHSRRFIRRLKRLGRR